MPAPSSVAVRAGLLAAWCVPVLYFGAQLVAMPFYPGYDIRSDGSRLLGSDFAAVPQIFNTSSFIAGLAIFVGAYGIHVALRAQGGRLVLVWLTTLALLSTGVSVLDAALFHLPHPAHAAPAAVSLGIVLLPLLLPIAFLSVKNATATKLYLLLNFLAYAALIPVVLGYIDYDRMSYGGLVQRFSSLTVFLPIGVVGAVLLRRTRRVATVASSASTT